MDISRRIMISKYRHVFSCGLPNQFYVTDGGIETSLVYLQGMDLPGFAAWPLLGDSNGCAALNAYFTEYAKLSYETNTHLILDTPTWRASKDYLEKENYNQDDMKSLMKTSVDALLVLRDKYEGSNNNIVISGCIGPRGDGYTSDTLMSSDDARIYHSVQMACFAETAIDLVSVYTINYSQEGIGAALAAQFYSLPVVISFTVETNGKLPSGETVSEAIQSCDEATSMYPVYYMLNCAHPSHFSAMLSDLVTTNPSVGSRIGGLKVNASSKSHEELDSSAELDIGDIDALASELKNIKEQNKFINIIGGCCGTDTRHIAAIIRECSGNL